MKKAVFMGLALSMCFSFNAYAGQWKEDANGWWWQWEDGSYPYSTWEWLDGNRDGIAEHYHFNENGYLDTNTTINNDQVNSDGARIWNGIVQTQQVPIYNPSAVGNPPLVQPQSGFVKQKWINLLGQNQQYVTSVLDKILVSDSGVTYFVDDHDDSSDIYIWNDIWNDQGIVDCVYSYELSSICNADKDKTYSVSEITALLGNDVKRFEESDTYAVWILSESPMVYLEHSKLTKLANGNFRLPAYSLKYYPGL
ncbi:MAG TPA: hypothetical protein H9740_13140 [Candidatus Hungatella pullicola]|nr:hypothetical protein [Candidatus Hungatella pullicola]